MAPATPPTMRGLVHNFSAGSLKLVDAIPVPVPKDDELLIRVEATALTNGELTWPRPPELNESFPGVDAAGVVVTSPASSKFRPGDKVYFRTTYPRAGSARQYSIALEKELALMPKNVSFAEAAAVPVSALTAWQTIFTEAGFNASFDRTGQDNQGHKRRIFINGASGGVGLWAVQLAHTAGFEVVGTSTNEQILRKLGADEVINYKNTSITEWLKSHTERFDIVLDLVGGSSLAEAWHAARPHGLVITIVPPADMQWKWDLDAPEGVNPTVKGKFVLMQPDGAQLSFISELIEKSGLRPVVDETFSVEEYERAFARVASGRAVGKVVLQIGGESA